jgi:hypothetical protein
MFLERLLTGWVRRRSLHSNFQLLVHITAAKPWVNPKTKDGPSSVTAVVEVYGKARTQDGRSDVSSVYTPCPVMSHRAIAYPGLQTHVAA